MARIRTIKPEFWRDEALSTISAEAALLAIGLLNHVDDEGYFNANPKLIASDVFPLRELSGSCTELLEELHRIGYIAVFEGADGKRYGQVVNFEKHQVINKKTASKIKGLLTFQHDYGSATGALPTGNGKEGKGREGKEGETSPAVAVPAPCFFEEFWDSWPKHTRKAAKDQCRNKWRSKGCDGIRAQVMASLEAHKASEAWKKGDGEFIPAPLTWLNQSRWEAPTQEQAEEELSPWYEGGRKTIEAKAVELGVGRWDESREQWGQYRHRVFVAAGHFPARSAA